MIHPIIKRTQHRNLLPQLRCENDDKWGINSRAGQLSLRTFLSCAKCLTLHSGSWWLNFSADESGWKNCSCVCFCWKAAYFCDRRQTHWLDERPSRTLSFSRFRQIHTHAAGCIIIIIRSERRSAAGPSPPCNINAPLFHQTPG